LLNPINWDSSQGDLYEAMTETNAVIASGDEVEAWQSVKAFRIDFEWRVNVGVSVLRDRDCFSRKLLRNDM